MATKLILDTDIGTDIDDAWALALCLASPEIELLGVTLVHADLDTRAKVALKMLKLAGRTDVPVYEGISDPLTEGHGRYWAGHEGTDTDFSDIAGLSAKDGALDFIVDTVGKYPGEVVVAPIGPMTNIGAAIRKDRSTMRSVRRFAVMGATYVGDGPENVAPEHNIRCDPLAAKIALESGIPATVVGLNVTNKVTIRRDDVEAIKGTPFGDYLAAMTDQLLRRHRPRLYVHARSARNRHRDRPLRCHHAQNDRRGARRRQGGIHSRRERPARRFRRCRCRQVRESTPIEGPLSV